MDTDMVAKFQATKNRKHQLLNNLFLYSLVALVCTLFCSSPLWFSPVFSSIKAFFFLSLPKFFSLLLSSKVLFIVGNLIVIILVRDSKTHVAADDRSPARDVCLDESVKRVECESPQSLSVSEEREERESEKCSVETVGSRNDGEGAEEEEEEAESETEAVEEINKRADAYIARVTQEMRLEAELILYTSK